MIRQSSSNNPSHQAFWRELPYCFNQYSSTGSMAQTTSVTGSAVRARPQAFWRELPYCFDQYSLTGSMAQTTSVTGSAVCARPQAFWRELPYCFDQYSLTGSMAQTTSVTGSAACARPAFCLLTDVTQIVPYQAINRSNAQTHSYRVRHQG